ncbi:hypothetical protein NE237_007957 [Protea cynaroides]|uniref:Uncharacterized protein n=1 Tax=Protea cynaroides TaxID=273540 RepID=A0A9Q0KQ57_9MAGN|nr:hypothetical protein NE237_007957 [Protea cynaroides]
MSHFQHAGREQIGDESDKTYLDRNQWIVMAGLVLLFLTGGDGGVLPPAYSSGDGATSSSSTEVARLPKKANPSLSGLIEPPSPNEEGLPSSPSSSLRFPSKSFPRFLLCSPTSSPWFSFIARRKKIEDWSNRCDDSLQVRRIFFPFLIKCCREIERKKKAV